jgi:hypothetical protein
MPGLPNFNTSGDLPPGIHVAKLEEVLKRFGTETPRRRQIAQRLSRILELAKGTGHLSKFVIFGSFITAEPLPNDVDLFFLMNDSFEVGKLTGEAALIFDHSMAQSYFGASIFWIRRISAIGGEKAAIEHWQIKRNGQLRGIVEVTND